MKSAFLAAIGLFSVVPMNAQTESLDVGRMVAVLKALENGPSDNPWQFSEATWAAYSKVPKHTASPQEHRRVAWVFTSACVRQAHSLDLPISPKWVACLWNAGYGTVRDSKMTADQREFGARAANLYADKSFNP